MSNSSRKTILDVSRIADNLSDIIRRLQKSERQVQAVVMAGLESSDSRLDPAAQNLKLIKRSDEGLCDCQNGMMWLLARCGDLDWVESGAAQSFDLEEHVNALRENGNEYSTIKKAAQNCRGEMLSWQKEFAKAEIMLKVLLSRMSDARESLLSHDVAELPITVEGIRRELLGGAVAINGLRDDVCSAKHYLELMSTRARACMEVCS